MRTYFEDLSADIFRTGTYASHLAAMKPWMEAIGFKVGPVQPPIRAIPPERAEELVAHLKKIGVA